MTFESNENSSIPRAHNKNLIRSLCHKSLRLSRDLKTFWTCLGNHKLFLKHFIDFFRFVFDTFVIGYFKENSPKRDFPTICFPYKIFAKKKSQPTTTGTMHEKEIIKINCVNKFLCGDFVLKICNVDCRWT